MRGFGPGRFSFNGAKGGRCVECAGQGVICHEMSFLPEVVTPCEACGGARFDRTTLEVRYLGHSIGDVLRLTAEEASQLFRVHPTDRELVDYRSTRTTPEEEARLQRLIRGLMERGVLMSITGLGCLSTPMGDAELEGLTETFAAVLETERAPR